MGTSIVLTEKPSQARNVQAAVGSKFGRVIALRGHMLRLAEPEEVNDAWKTWDYSLLRPEGGFYPFRRDTQFGKGALLKELEQAIPQADRVIIATDCDREGQAIGENLLRYFKFRGQAMRVMFNAEDEKSLREAFDRMTPNSEHLPLYQSAVARVQLDQIANFTATRVVTLALKPAGMRGAMGMGRVKTPTMAIVCRRQLEIAGFKPRAYYDLWVDLEHAGQVVRLTHVPKDEARFFDQAEANGVVAPLSSWNGAVRVVTERKRQAPPKLPHLPTLQAKAGGWGWSAKRTLDTAQSLYETHKVTTYPRADNRYLPEVEIDNAGAMLAGLAGLPFVQVGYVEPTIRKGKAGHFSDAMLAGSSHHAIVPNIKTVDRWADAYQAMTADERRLFELIARTYLAAIGPDREYDRTEFSIEVNRRKFSVAGTVERVPGWREAMGLGDAPAAAEDGEDEGSAVLPPWKDGAQAAATGSGLSDKVTKPPAQFTEGTLIIAMEEAWRYAEDPAMVEKLKEAKGIGTTATRDTIIDGLKKQGYLAVEKGGKLSATPLALGLYHELMKDCPEWLDPAVTAEMEMALDEIQRGTVEPRAVINDALVKTEKLIQCMKSRADHGGPLQVQVKQPPSAAMLNAAKAKAKREGVALPRGAASDAAVCREFLGPRPEGNAPTEGQVKFAREIAQALGAELDETTLGDRRELSKWIDQNKDKMPRDETLDVPTSKQVALAEKIAGSKGLEIPAETLRSKSSLSKWIDANSDRTKGRKPSAKRGARK